MTLPVQLLIPVAIQLLSLDLFQSRTPEIIQTTLKNVINNQTSNGQYETCEPPVTLICPSHSSCYQVPQESCGAIDGFCRTLLINMCLERITAPTFEREVCSIIYTKLFSLPFLFLLTILKVTIVNSYMDSNDVHHVVKRTTDSDGIIVKLLATPPAYNLRLKIDHMPSLTEHPAIQLLTDRVNYSKKFVNSTSFDLSMVRCCAD